MKGEIKNREYPDLLEFTETYDASHHRLPEQTLSPESPVNYFPVPASRRETLNLEPEATGTLTSAPEKNKNGVLPLDIQETRLGGQKLSV